MNDFKESLKKDVFERLRYRQSPEIAGQSPKVMHNKNYFLQPERLREIFGLDKQQKRESEEERD